MIKDTSASKIIVYEQLIPDTKGTIASLYDHWGIQPPQHHIHYTNNNPLENDTSHMHLSTLEIEQIENQLGTLYLKSCSPYLSTIRSALSSKTWFGFDLDDTLHEFRKASSHASSSVFEAIHQESNISIDTLKATYADILRSKTASAFSDGRTSTEYRRERFSCLLQIHNLHTTEERLFRLLSIYQASLQTALTRKPHAFTLLEKIKALNKNVIVVTEGPQDSQEWTVEQLGLRPYIDIIVTTNEVGKAKVDGLFSVVLEKYHISARDIVYVGDNAVRDILPAQEVGILAVLYDEKRDCRFDDPGVFRVNSLGKLVGLIE
ncbi:hypothetical protein ASPWEDRAFT_161818 [Aspergillus wentii DTO 134E9]|uniref:Uncharacterized protein n=1 Tax=Aspergillus wentii DTO 134E9 TaxID=1073089 RepID=A0A1L9RBQ0_ASPWE|nr:uncharacterized protein ASPWEDRAFT_161818 [Aspergillus wentii DTO 134E9]OJJ32355.1 hypothetical protein ASPWEDRAFT_161818 [Aspergillus wentii DTO 134E9]